MIMIVAVAVIAIISLGSISWLLWSRVLKSSDMAVDVVSLEQSPLETIPEDAEDEDDEQTEQNEPENFDANAIPLFTPLAALVRL